ncbi:vacuolar protein sorting 41 [Tremella mesenterica]|uniref:Vacuolar protein sorting-associated protein 41 n=1 Tax=Tremella mesenterica TaxID=5217 RepID=A0A4Q1BG05_TREME|nr:vacuolar protein sorting 41 [Tremella mesenterica]
MTSHEQAVDHSSTTPEPGRGPESAGPSRTPSVSSGTISSSTPSRKGKERAQSIEARNGRSMSPRPRQINPTDDSNGRINGVQSEDDESEDDAEEEEPALKYSRLKGQIPEILAKDTASAIDISPRVIALGTHNGMVHVLSYEGSKVNSFRPHAASITCLRMDEENDFVATASFEGRVVIHSITSTESYAFDYKRPMRAIALEPGFSKKTTRRFVCGGMAGNLILQEKGWLGYKEQILHSGEGPIWAIEWRGSLIAWANDMANRGANAPRAELFRCTLVWKDDTTLLIAWADHIKVVRIRSRSRPTASIGPPILSIELTADYQVDCMISGIAQYQSSYMVLAYISPDTFENEATQDRAEQRRKAANPPELRLIQKGEEVSADELQLSNFHMNGCNDYSLVKSRRDQEVFFVLSPSDVIVVRPRDDADHVEWLVERERFEEALTAAEVMQMEHGAALDVKAIGLKYMRHLIERGDYAHAANLAPKMLKSDRQGWETWVYIFVQKHQLSAIIPLIPTKEPQLSRPVYEMIIGYLVVNDRLLLLEILTTWPADVYDIGTVMSAVQGELQATKDDPTLLECMGELHILSRQPAKALPYFLRLRKSNVFDLIREHNLFSAIQDQALLLVEFDQERVTHTPQENPNAEKGKHGAAIQLLVDHTHSIPIDRVVHQLEVRPQYLYMYLDTLFDKDSQLILPYSDRMIELCAAYDREKLMPFLRASNFYDLEKALNICKSREYVDEMVFLLGRMGNNKQALMLIIERLGDVKKAIEFASEQADEDLWEDLLSYSETRPDFIRALLEHVGAEINPIRLIRRIKDGMEIPGLKPALVKILQASNLQVSLLDGCRHVLNSDCSFLATDLQKGQTGSARGSLSSTCDFCQLPLFPPSASSSSPIVPTLGYLCKHLVHSTCSLLNADVELPVREDAAVSHLLSGDRGKSVRTRQRELGAKLSYAAAVRVRVGGCPVCSHKRGEATRRAVPA